MVSGLSPAGTVSPIGLERLWRSSRSQAPSVSAAAPMINQLARKGEDIEHASRGRFVEKVLDCIGETERRGRIAGIELGVDDSASPATDAGDDRDILAAVGTAIADRLADDSAAGLELPQQLSGSRVERFEPAVQSAVEDQSAAGRQRRAPGREILLML